MSRRAPRWPSATADHWYDRPLAFVLIPLGIVGFIAGVLAAPVVRGFRVGRQLARDTISRVDVK